MSLQLFKDLLFLEIWAIALFFCLLHEEALINKEQRFFRKIKRYAYAFVRTVEACAAERKGNMFIILKAPGHAPERRHNISNTYGALYREIDSENPGHIEIMPGVYMCYDADGFAKASAPCMADERVEKIYYGEVAFYATNEKDKALRSLTEREAKAVLNYIAQLRADKLCH